MWLEYLRIAWSVLRGHKLRSFLTVASITAGAFSIVLMTSLADSGFRTLLAGLEEIGGARLIAVWARPPEDALKSTVSYNGGLSTADMEVVRAVPHVVRSTVLADRSKVEVTSDRGQKFLTDTVATDPAFLSFFGYKIAEGRALDEADGRNHARVCVVGHKTAETLSAPGSDGKRAPLLGTLLTVLGIRCQVVGRLAELDRWGSGLGWEWDDVVLMPLPVLLDHSRKEVEQTRWLVLNADDESNNEIVKRVINARLLERHHGLGDFQIIDFHKAFLGDFMQVLSTMKLIVGLLAGISLLVGGVGVMNIMLVSVSERTREIGIRKTLGASPSDIGRQFLTEAILLAGAGGFGGAALGVLGTVLGSAVIRHFKPRWISAVSEPALFGALFVTVLVGVVFGYYPARKASKLDAAVAIRAGG